MTEQRITADYLIVGAGAVGMAFADTLLTETNATIAIIDRNHQPAGHWNDAYPFVRLHGPSAIYGVNSRELGSGRIDSNGLNKGYHELASGADIVSYFDAVMRERFLPSGRVQYFPMSAYESGVVTSLVSGECRVVTTGKVVDATLTNTLVPSRRPPAYGVAPGIVCAPLNDLPRLTRVGAKYVIIGAGKTAIDACCWLLSNGANPNSISWIMPRDSWLLDRKFFQPDQESLLPTLTFIANQVETIVNADTVEQVFAGMEACGAWRRIDPAINPTAYHCAIVSDEELRQLRRIRNIVRQGRVNRIEADRIVLEHGEIMTNQDVLHIDCSAVGIPPSTETPIFQPGRIALQWVRWCTPCFSAAFIAHVEAAYADDQEKNHLCKPVPTPHVPLDALRMMAIDLGNGYSWARDEGLRRWLAQSRLDLVAARIGALKPTDSMEIAELERYRANIGPAMTKLKHFLHGAS